MDIYDRLRDHGKRTISLPELTHLMGIGPFDTEALYTEISSLTKNEVIDPVIASGTNGNRQYPLFLKYRILITDKTSDDLIKQIQILHPLLLRSGYLGSHHTQYEEYKEILDSLSRYLFKNQIEDKISRKERSFDIFGKEKILDDKGVKALLKNLYLSDKELGFYDTPEYCFYDYIPQKKNKMTLLICENKDIWFNIRRCMFEDGFTNVFGVHVDGVVYGEGNRVSQRQGALTEYVKFMGCQDVSFLYWGDIDREGFEIFKKVVKYNETLNISLFVQGYRMMIQESQLRLSQGAELEDSSSSKYAQMDYVELLADFTDNERLYLNNCLKRNKLIPQEIVSYRKLTC